jgi:acetyl-CoA synthetase
MSVTDDSRSSRDIDTALAEDRRFPPDQEFAATANADSAIYDRDFDEFWTSEGRMRISWFRHFEALYEWRLPYAKWYLGGSLNACYNCVDRHVATGNGDKVAYYWEGEPSGDRRVLTFADLQREVVRFAAGLSRDLHGHGPGAGHRDAGLRAPRGAVHGGVRRVLRRGTGRPAH